MLLPRRTKLDSQLFELANTVGETEMLISDASDAPNTMPILELAQAPTRRGLATRSAPVRPSETVTIKLLSNEGSREALEADLVELGAEIVSSGPQVILANVPANNLNALENVTTLLRAEQSRRLQFKLDEARGTETRTDIALAQHQNLRGQDVVVGVVDTGVDWRHQDFRDAGGNTRIEYFLHAQHNQQTGTDTFNAYDSQQIDAALNGNPHSFVPDGDLNGHGTHCASIAAGNGLASANQVYRGVAPEAVLMGVRTDTLHDTHVIRGIRDIFANAGDRPAVVNLSLGGHMGPHDGTSALENVISKETGPGRIVVVAAGNEAEDRIHFQGNLVAGQDLDIEFTIRDAVQYVDVWIPRDDLVNITVVDPNGTVTTPNGSLQQTSAGQFRAQLLVDPFNRDVNLSFAVAAQQLGRRWRLRLNATSVRHGTVHAWSQTRNPDFSRRIFMSQNSPLYSIGMPATEERAISVGSIVTRSQILPQGPTPAGLTSGQLSPFSSHGPARHGAMRPDIAAPGQHIIAALAANSSMANAASLANRRLPGGNYISIQGTSMATPFVTGVIALMLQQNPNLTPEDIQLRLRATAKRDSQTGVVWNPGFGYGKIDVEALLNY